MGQGDTAVWTNWIREETDEIMKQLEEERDSRSNPNDPFNGTANGVFLPLQDPLSLPPPVQTPKRQENNSESSEPSQNSRENVRKTEYSKARMREQMKRSLPRKENHANFENILENHWIRWRVFTICTSNRDKTDVAHRS